MKKIFTFCAAALMSIGALAQSPIGIYRSLDLTTLEVGDCSVAEAYGVKVTPIRGTGTTYRDEVGQDDPSASDLYIGYSITEGAAANKAASAAYAADCVIYPKVAEQSARQAEEYFGFTMDIPADKPINIEALDVYLLAGNAYMWQVEITDEAGNVVYKTQDKGIKVNNYNKTAYTNGIHVTTTEVTEPEWSQELLKGWNLATNYDVAASEPLPALTKLTGKYNVKVYYWGKWQKNLTYANVYIYATSEGGDTSAPGNAGIYRPLDLTTLEVGDCSVAEACGVKVTPIRGTGTTYRDEAGQDDPSASDLYIGYSITEGAAANKAASAAYAADCVIYPKVAEQSARQAEEYFGFTMDIPADKPINIEALDVYLLAGNAYMWQVEITDEAGNVVYKTQDKGIKVNNYNKTAYTNGIHVTTTEVTEPEWSQELLKGWNLATNYDVAATDPLPALKNLTGKYSVKVYYWGKWQKNLTYANVYVELSNGDATAISTITSENVVKNGAMYNLAGQRIAAPVKGQIYIKDGKKHIMR